MQILDLATERCIVTGEPAMVYTGHLLALLDDVRVKISAGFKDSETAADLTMSSNGCYGNWREEYGITHIIDSEDTEYGLGQKATKRVSLCGQHFSD